MCNGNRKSPTAPTNLATYQDTEGTNVAAFIFRFKQSKQSIPSHDKI